MSINEPKDFIEYFESEVLRRGGHRYAILSTYPVQNQKEVKNDLSCHSSYPQVRNIIVRNYKTNQHVIRFYTHGLSAKIQQLEENALCSICWYDPKEKVQIRMHAQAQIIFNKELEDQLFLETSESTKQDYLSQGKQGHFLKVIDLNIKSYDFLRIDHLKHIKRHLRLD